jgi:NADPH:quinone reductase-like Zn-dependent oxidoreductase
VATRLLVPGGRDVRPWAAKIQGGQDVLVYGATGAIGLAAVQLLRSLGASVTTVCGTDNVNVSAGSDRRGLQVVETGQKIGNVVISVEPSN